MADYIVKDTELTSVANAIRTAGGTNSLLSFPNGFVSAVNNISGGGGSSDFSTATVTFVNNAGYFITSSIVCQQFDNGDFTEKNTAFILDDEIGVNIYPEVTINEGTTTRSFYLLNGCNFGIGFDVNNVNVSGSCELITYADLPTAIVTGDCTITIS